MKTFQESIDVGEVDLCHHACHGEVKPEAAWWLLSIREGRASIFCGTCQCDFDGIVDDGTDIELVQPIPVRIAVKDDYTPTGYSARGTYWLEVKARVA